jgi:hypothetical protein
MAENAPLVSARDLVVNADHHSIWIYRSDYYENGGADFAAIRAAVDDATGCGRFVAVLPGYIQLLTPGQWNYKTPIRLEIWSVEPPDDRAAWDHEVDADFDVPEGQICFSAPACGVTAADILAGSYRVRVSGKGFTEIGQAGANGDDCYRLRLWPRDQDSAPALRKRWPGWDAWR